MSKRISMRQLELTLEFESPAHVRITFATPEARRGRKPKRRAAKTNPPVDGGSNEPPGIQIQDMSPGIEELMKLYLRRPID